jgi:hypothetical protein
MTIIQSGFFHWFSLVSGGYSHGIRSTSDDRDPLLGPITPGNGSGYLSQHISVNQSALVHMRADESSTAALGTISWGFPGDSPLDFCIENQGMIWILPRQAS